MHEVTNLLKFGPSGSIQYSGNLKGRGSTVGKEKRDWPGIEIMIIEN